MVQGVKIGHMSMLVWNGSGARGDSLEIVEHERSVSTKTRPTTSSLLPVELPYCPVCWDGYDHGKRMPRVLHCGHTICQDCLEHLFFDAGFAQRCVRCPECRGMCVWRGQQLPKNYVLLQILSSCSSTQDSSNTQKKCSAPAAVPVVLQLSHLFSTIIMHYVSFGIIPSIVVILERKLWEITRVIFATTAMLIFIPLSLTHMVLAWWTATIGFCVFLWSSLGSMGIAVFMFFTCCNFHLFHFLLEIGAAHFHRLRCKYSHLRFALSR